MIQNPSFPTRTPHANVIAGPPQAGQTPVAIRVILADKCNRVNLRQIVPAVEACVAGKRGIDHVVNASRREGTRTVDIRGRDVAKVPRPELRKLDAPTVVEEVSDREGSLPNSIHDLRIKLVLKWGDDHNVRAFTFNQGQQSPVHSLSAHRLYFFHVVD